MNDLPAHSYAFDVLLVAVGVLFGAAVEERTAVWGATIAIVLAGVAILFRGSL